MRQYSSSQLTIDNISFEREGSVLFSDINQILHAGDVLQITGENGSGKSTLLRLLAGFIELQEGIISWQSKSSDSDDYQQNLHYLGHQNGIRPNLTIYENLQLCSALTQNKKSLTTIKDVVEKVNLTHALHIHALDLSAGQSRRLALSRLLLNPKPLWILDEPTTSLDAKGHVLFSDLVMQHCNAGGIAIIATHQLLQINNPIKKINLRGAYA